MVALPFPKVRWRKCWVKYPMELILYGRVFSLCIVSVKSILDWNPGQPWATKKSKISGSWQACWSHLNMSQVKYLSGERYVTIPNLIPLVNCLNNQLNSFEINSESVCSVKQRGTHEFNKTSMATSVPCERLFSKAGATVTERRYRLTGKNLGKFKSSSEVWVTKNGLVRQFLCLLAKHYNVIVLWL